MTDLIQRLETEAPSRELADEVLLEFGWTKKRCPSFPSCEIMVSPTGDEFHLLDERKDKAPRKPNPLQSIDDAVALIPAGKYWELRAYKPPGCFSACVSITWPSPGPHLFGQSHKSPAIALTIAALKAKEQSNG